jgi:hypothetical protein
MRTTTPPTPLPTNYAQIAPAQVYKGRKRHYAIEQK